jgi:hypothetical protein
MKPSIALAILMCALVASTTARAAGSEAPPTAEGPAVVAARDEFKKGIAFAKDTQWVEALGAFERAQALHENSVIAFNIAICHRALGNYTLARAGFAASASASGDRALPPSLQEEARADVAQIDGLLVHAAVTLDPPDATISVDGRPLQKDNDTFTAGVLPPGAAAAVPNAAFELVMSPGSHLITIAKAGYGTATVTRVFANGEHTKLPLSLSLLPATIHVSATQPDAVVTINGADVGMAPVDISRHAGSYHVRLLHQGFEPYESDVTVKPGEEANLRAALLAEKIPVYKKWWFWTGAAAVVLGGVLITYELTRDTRPPAYNGGSTGWVVTPSGLRF